MQDRHTTDDRGTERERERERERLKLRNLSLLIYGVSAAITFPEQGTNTAHCVR